MLSFMLRGPVPQFMPMISMGKGSSAERAALISVPFSIVPKTGGNTYKGSASFQFANSSLQSDNYNDTLRSVLKDPAFDILVQSLASGGVVSEHR